MNTVTVHSPRDNRLVTYIIPTMAQCLAHSRATHGKQWDAIERQMVTGGLPIVMERVK